MIIGTVGRLGVGKTLSLVIEAYRDYCYQQKIFSNIWLNFLHAPIRTAYDFLGLGEGSLLADELWTLADNRKSNSLLSDIITIICLRSRKRRFNVFYSQQYLQIDVRIRFITDFWIRPTVIRDKDNVPRILIQKVWDSEWNFYPIRQIDCTPYLTMFDTETDPYTLRSSLSDKSMREALDRAYAQNPRLSRELEELKVKAQKSDRPRIIPD